MSTSSAAFFAWVQGAPFYEDLHRDAVALAPRATSSARWLDVGTGPGLVARLAAERGFDALGVDRDPAMIDVASRAARPGLRFAVADLEGAGTVLRGGADVVSAASLLHVVPDRSLALTALWRAVAPGGALLVVETSDLMRVARVPAALRGARPGRTSALWLWAALRAGRTVDPRLYASVGATSVERHSLLAGLVDAWVLRRGV